MPRNRVIGIVLIVVGVAVPQVIDAYETAHHLDIPRDIGVLPWFIMTIVGIGLFLHSFRDR